MKRILSISVLGVFIATACGRSVDLGGDDRNDDQPGGAGGEDGQGDDDGRTGGKGFGGTVAGHGGTAGFAAYGGDGNVAGSGNIAGSFGFGGWAGDGNVAGSFGFGGWGGDGNVAGSFGFGGWAGDGNVAGSFGFGGWAGDGNVAGSFGVGGWAGDGNVAGSGNIAGSFGFGGFGGSGGGPSVLPTCVTHLYEACWPFGECREDPTDATRCYESGVKIVTAPLSIACGGSGERYYNAAGALCFSFVEGALPEHYCETAYRRWYGPDGTLIAESLGTFTRPFTNPTCVSGPTIPCADGAGARCDWPGADCERGECPYITPEIQKSGR